MLVAIGKLLFLSYFFQFLLIMSYSLQAFCCTVVMHKITYVNSLNTYDRWRIIGGRYHIKTLDLVLILFYLFEEFELILAVLKELKNNRKYFVLLIAIISEIFLGYSKDIFTKFLSEFLLVFFLNNTVSFVNAFNWFT